MARFSKPDIHLCGAAAIWGMRGQQSGCPIVVTVKSSGANKTPLSAPSVELHSGVCYSGGTAVKDKKNPYYALKYERIAKRRGKKRAIIAIARMILTAIYSMFCTGEVWNPVDIFKIDMPEHLKEQQLAKAIKQAKRFLEKQGLTVA